MGDAAEGTTPPSTEGGGGAEGLTLDTPDEDDDSDDPNELTLRRGDFDDPMCVTREPTGVAGEELPPGTIVRVGDVAMVQQVLGSEHWEPDLEPYCGSAWDGTVIRHSGKYTFVRFVHDPPLPGGVTQTGRTLPRSCLLRTDALPDAPPDDGVPTAAAAAPAADDGVK